MLTIRTLLITGLLVAAPAIRAKEVPSSTNISFFVGSVSPNATPEQRAAIKAALAKIPGCQKDDLRAEQRAMCDLNQEELTRLYLEHGKCIMGQGRNTRNNDKTSIDLNFYSNTPIETTSIEQKAEQLLASQFDTSKPTNSAPLKAEVTAEQAPTN